MEHITHIDDFAGVQIVQAHDVLKVTHPVEPKVGSRRTDTSKRRVKDDLGHIGFYFFILPMWSIVFRVQVVGRARATTAQVVVVERERRVIWRVAGVGLGASSSEIAWVARSAVDVGIGLISVVFIIDSALAAHQSDVDIEHTLGGRHGSRAPVLTHIDGLQFGAVSEHALHIGHIGGVETAHVKACQA